MMSDVGTSRWCSKSFQFWKRLVIWVRNSYLALESVTFNHDYVLEALLLNELKVLR